MQSRSLLLVVIVVTHLHPPPKSYFAMAGAFTPEEWLAISPTSGVGAGANKTDGKGPSDDASYGDLFRTVARFSPLLARLQRLQTVCMRVIPTATAFLLDVVLFFGTLVLLAMIPSLVPNAGPATTIGIVFSGIWMAQHSVLCIEYVLRYRVNPVRGPPQGAKQIKFWAALFPQNNNLDDREANNVNDGIPAMAGRLLAHDPADELCPCGLASCSGTLPRQATTRYLISGCFLFLVMASTHVLTLWTPLVTLGYTVWRTWWGGLLGGVLLLIIVVQAVIHISRVSYHANERLQEISLRLQRRAAALVIGDLVKMVETDPESFAASSDPKSTALYAELYRQLVSNWNMSGATRSPTTHSYSGRIVYYSIPVLVVTIIINAVSLACGELEVF